jgi:hypothetical protein
MNRIETNNNGNPSPIEAIVNAIQALSSEDRDELLRKLSRERLSEDYAVIDVAILGLGEDVRKRLIEALLAWPETARRLSVLATAYRRCNRVKRDRTAARHAAMKAAQAAGIADADLYSFMLREHDDLMKVNGRLIDEKSMWRTFARSGK